MHSKEAGTQHRLLRRARSLLSASSSASCCTPPCGSSHVSYSVSRAPYTLHQLSLCRRMSRNTTHPLISLRCCTYRAAWRAASLAHLRPGMLPR